MCDCAAQNHSVAEPRSLKQIERVVTSFAHQLKLVFRNVLNALRERDLPPPEAPVLAGLTGQDTDAPGIMLQPNPHSRLQLRVALVVPVLHGGTGSGLVCGVFHRKSRSLRRSRHEADQEILRRLVATEGHHPAILPNPPHQTLTIRKTNLSASEREAIPAERLSDILGLERVGLQRALEAVDVRRRPHPLQALRHTLGIAVFAAQG